VGSKDRIHFCKILDIFPQAVLFVEPQDYNKYKEAFPNNEIVQLKENDKGFGYMLNNLVDYTLTNGDKYFLFADDDIFGLKERTEEGKMKNIEDKEGFFKRGLKLLELGYVQVAISFMGHNWYEEKMFKDTVGAWGMWFGNAEAIKKVGGYLEDLPIFNDWEMSARLILGGYKNCCIYRYAFVHKMKSQSGGAMSLYQKGDRVTAGVQMIRAMYPQSSKEVYVPNHGLLEVRFDWNKLKQGIR
jgi:GT2 family glycosyltransferase